MSVIKLFAIKYITIFMFSSISVECKPVVIKGSSPFGESVVAISSSDPKLGKMFTLKFQQPEGLFGHNFNIPIAPPRPTSVGTGRAFTSSSSFNPFNFPIFNIPLNLEGIGLSNIGFPNWFRSFENFYDPAYSGNGDVNSVTAVNDNGHVYGNVNSVSFDNRAKNN